MPLCGPCLRSPPTHKICSINMWVKRYTETNCITGAPIRCRYCLMKRSDHFSYCFLSWHGNTVFSPQALLLFFSPFFICFTFSLYSSLFQHMLYTTTTTKGSYKFYEKFWVSRRKINSKCPYLINVGSFQLRRIYNNKVLPAQNTRHQDFGIWGMGLFSFWL